MSFKDAKKLNFLTTVEQRQKQTQQQFLAACQATGDVYANWLGYKANEADSAAIAATSLEFATANREMIDAVKGQLALALDIIAGGTVDGEGNPLTRQDLLDEVAAMPTAAQLAQE